MFGFIVFIVVLICITIVCLILALQVNIRFICPDREAKILLYASGIALLGVFILLDISNIIKIC